VSVLAALAGKDVLVGVIDVGTEEVELPETVAERIRRALPFVPPERLYPCTDCGMVPRGRAAARGKLAALAAGAAIVRAELERDSGCSRTSALTSGARIERAKESGARGRA
jgi:5-methyltetrahydropteroyltriglutamate--homocysteine methyltransferase